MKKTKIVATVSDLRCDVEFIRDLYREGVNVVRLNTAHQSFDDTLKVIRNVRAVSDKIALLLDTKGPEIRTNEFEKERFFREGEEVFVRGGLMGVQNEKTICVSCEGIVEDVGVGKSLLIDDGALEFKVVCKKDGALVCRVMNDGGIKGRKSVNVPGVSINLPSLTQKDMDYIEFAAREKIDFIAHSFVRSKADVLDVQKISDRVGSSAKIIAKIENQEGVDNLDEILDVAYGVMVARGDLGIEIAAEKIPAIQQEIIKACVKRKRPVIVATQMLHTMIENPRATRAEIADISNAVRSGTDAVMLSGETAYGKYPIEAVRIMAKVAKETEISNGKDAWEKRSDGRIPDFLANAAVRASLDLPIRAILCDSVSGRTARYLSSFRGKSLVFCQCYTEEVVRHLALSYGVYSTYMDRSKVGERFVGMSLGTLLKRDDFCKEDLVVVLAGHFGDNVGASFVEVSSIGNLLKKD